jgi:sigma54-dependent transcription regulator
MLVHDKNLAKLDQIADTTVESIDLFSQEQIENAIAAVKRIAKSLTEAKKSFAKPVEVVEVTDEEVDNDTEE